MSIGYDPKFDMLNGGALRQEHIDEVKQAQEDSYNHTVKLSEGFTNWLNDAYNNQHRERQEQAQRMRENMFPEPEKDPMDQAIRDRLHGKETQFQLRQRMRGSFFPDAEIKRRQEENESKRHPMDQAMRKQLSDRSHYSDGMYLDDDGHFRWKP